ncbi:hypothetical protein PR048_000372 [Dryococelus australis]|uniref:HAT C-terminal dimerisation domain-containing protein n=1 Tax=Dryococelus australis TaxID=614101 RepID=A0ABQ9IEE2_9NEOP|nr:hypothetical protein PR048_000372 [Dryococelus australis]
MKYLKSIHESNLGSMKLKTLHLLNILKELKLDSLFPNAYIAIRVFCTIPVAVAEAERTFSKIKVTKNIHIPTTSQERMTALTLLATESDLAKTINFDDIINNFASKKARRTAL